MDKVIVERPRHGGGQIKGYQRRVLGRGGAEDLPTKEGMRRPYGYDGKELNENLRPLSRYLDKQVRRPWDKVYSEIRQNIRFENAVQQHILTHLRHLVKLHVVEQDGTIFEVAPLYGSGSRELHTGDLYVHPRTGLLRRYQRKSAPPAPPPPSNNMPIDATHQYHRHRGVWYHVSMAPYVAACVDVFLGSLPSPGYSRHSAAFHAYGRDGVYAVAKRQVGKKELHGVAREHGAHRVRRLQN